MQLQATPVQLALNLIAGPLAPQQVEKQSL